MKFTGEKQVIDNSGALLVEYVNVLKQKVNNGWGALVTKSSML
jgi:ribosomal protein L14